jgi:hypothetical protein
MRRIITASITGAAIALLAAPAFADTLTEVTTKGMVLTVMGMDIDVTYTPDGKWAAKNDDLTAMLGAELTGAWRIDGDKLCTTSTVVPDEDCAVYPAGKTSGDSFEVSGANGPAMVKIK